MRETIGEASEEHMKHRMEDNGKTHATKRRRNDKKFHNEEEDKT